MNNKKETRKTRQPRDSNNVAITNLWKCPKFGFISSIFFVCGFGERWSCWKYRYLIAFVEWQEQENWKDFQVRHYSIEGISECIKLRRRHDRSCFAQVNTRTFDIDFLRNSSDSVSSSIMSNGQPTAKISLVIVCRRTPWRWTDET